MFLISGIMLDSLFPEVDGIESLGVVLIGETLGSAFRRKYANCSTIPVSPRNEVHSHLVNLRGLFELPTIKKRPLRRGALAFVQHTWPFTHPMACPTSQSRTRELSGGKVGQVLTLAQTTSNKTYVVT